jgi:hypothetical protein
MRVKTMNKQKIAKLLIINIVALITTVGIDQPSLTTSNSINHIHRYINLQLKHPPDYTTRIDSSNFSQTQISLENNRVQFDQNVKNNSELLGLNFQSKSLLKAFKKIGDGLQFLSNFLSNCNQENKYCTKDWFPILTITGGLLGIAIIGGIVDYIIKNTKS